MAKRKSGGNQPPKNKKPNNKVTQKQDEQLERQIELLEKILKIQQDNADAQEKAISDQVTFNKQLTLTQKGFEKLKETLVDTFSKLDLVDYLKDSDKALKSVNVSLGTSGSLAATYRDNMSNAAFDVARLGVSLKDLADIQTGFVEETGKLTPLTENALKRTSAMTKAIGLGANDSGKLVGNFNTVGFSAEQTAKFVEDTLNSSESMGISGTKVVKTLVSNFDKINKYNFRNGVESFKSMVQFSEKTRQNLEGVFTAADKFRTIEGAIEATAELQTLGGAMAQADGFQLGFLARNDPEQFAKELHKMTEGIYSFDKASGQFKASAVDLDRLRRLAEITGQDFNELSKEARKASEIKFMSSKMFGLSKDDKELVSQLASFDQTTKKFTVKLDGKDVDISKLTTDQLSLLKNQQKTLEERTKAGISFDEEFNNTMLQLKTLLLPILKTINSMLSSMNDLFGDSGTILGTLGKLTTMGVAGGIGSYVLSGDRIKDLGEGKMFGKQMWGKTSKDGGKTSKDGGKTSKDGGKAVSNTVDKLGDSLNKIPDGGSLASKAKGIMAIGVAAAGIGIGIGAAAAGIGYMADNFAKLNPDQLNAVIKSLTAIGVTMGVLGVVGSLAGSGLMAAGAGFLMIGAGIGIASAGVGYMVSQFNQLSNPDLGKNVLTLSAGVASLAESSMLFANPLTLVGLAGFTTAMNSLDNIGNIKPLTDFMLAPKDNLVELRETINLLKGADLKGLSELKNMLAELSNKPLQVEFKDKDVKLNVNTTLMLDRDVLVKNLQIGKTATIEVVNFKRGT